MWKEFLAAGLSLVLFPHVALVPRIDDRIVVQGVVRNVVVSEGSSGPVTDLEIEGTLGKERPDARRIYTRTDSAGHFQLECPDSGDRPLKLGIRVEGDVTHRWAYLDCELGEGERAIDGLVLERVPWGDLHGRVVDADGEVVPHIAFALPEMPLHFNPLVGTADLREAESDERGEFLVEDYKGSHGPDVQVKSSGWRLLRKSPTNPRDRGGWEPMTVVLTPTGVLSVHAVDAHGNSVQGLEIAVWISPSEREGREGSSDWFRLEAQTDEEGRVHFDDVWAERYLVLGAQRESSSWEYVRHDGKQVIAEDAGVERGATQPLVVPAAGELKLEMVLADPLVLRGSVRDEAGAPVPRACVLLRDADSPRLPWTGRYEEFVHADEQGNFEVSLHPPGLPERLRWMAADVLWDLGDPTLPDSLDRSTTSQQGLAVIESALDVASSSGKPVEIKLAKTLEISGHVVGEDGKPLRAGIRAVPRGASLVATLESLTSSFASSQKDGSFCIRGLPAGTYDLLVELEKYRRDDSSLARARFEGIATGARSQVLKVRDPATVRVHVVTESPGRRIRSIDVRLVRVHPRHPESFEAQRPDRDARFHSFAGWPPMEGYVSAEGRSLLCDEIGLQEFFSFSSLDLGHDASTLDLPPIDAGSYWIGVRAHGESMQDYHPTGTGMVILTNGEYRFTFLVDPSASLSGITSTKGAVGELAIALVGAKGEAVQCRGPNWSFDTLAGIGFGGRFHLGEIPAGRFRIRVGQMSELRQGRFLFEREVFLEAGENGPLRFE